MEKQFSPKLLLARTLGAVPAALRERAETVSPEEAEDIIQYVTRQVRYK